jgi:hypothetical protein
VHPVYLYSWGYIGCRMQNLEPEEEINVSDSPAQQVIIQRVSADSSQQASVGCSNKNRKKKKKVTSFKNYIYIFKSG